MITHNIVMWENTAKQCRLGLFQDSDFAKTIAWSDDMEEDVQKSMERYCELANKNVEQLHKVASPCLDDQQF